MKAEKIASRVCDAVLEKKGFEILLMDLTEPSPVTDFFVITSATTDVHAKAIADHVVKVLASRGVQKWQMEGYPLGHWILIDYVDVVVHIFLEETRRYYGLERLWGDAPTTRIDEIEI